MAGHRITLVSRSALAVYVPLMLWLLLAPSPPSALPGSDGSGHLVGFMVLGLLVGAAAGPVGRDTRLVWIVASGAAFALATEALQGPVPGRTPSLSDLATDALGITLAALLWWFAASVWQRPDAAD